MNSMSGEKLKGIPYTGTLPATLTGTKAGYLHRYKIYGNTEQNGTPTPENPIVPSECGERTENLWNFQPSTEQSGVTLTWNGAKIVFSGICTSSTNLIKIITLSAGTYTIKANANRIPVEDDNSCVDVYKASPYMMAKISNRNAINGIVNFTLGEETTVSLRIRVQATVNYDGFTLEPMLNSGSTPLPYEPYGYKLPMLSGSTPVDIYFGESQTTRRIKKLVLTGEEKIYNVTESTTHQGVYLFVYRFSDIGMNDIINFNLRMNTIPYPQFVSSHFVLKSSEHRENWRDTDENEMSANTISDATSNLYIIFGISGITNSNDFKAYLAQQYAAGTPVTIWYVLATEETGTLNEPLRKIGNYADTIDSTQTSSQIPTTANSTTISWGGQGLAPSEFDSIQEWVNTPTYKRVNGAWVADNSNSN